MQLHGKELWSCSKDNRERELLTLKPTEGVSDGFPSEKCWLANFSSGQQAAHLPSYFGSVDEDHSAHLEKHDF